MDVLVATDQWFPDVLGGVARVATETSRRLAARGHDVTVVAPRADGAVREDRDGSLRLCRALPRGRLPRTLTDVAATARAARRISGRLDVLVAHTSTTALGLSLSRKTAPLVYVFHADAAEEVRWLGRQGSLGRRITQPALTQSLELIGRSSLHRAQSIAVLSEYSRSLLGRIDGKLESLAVVLPCGVDTRRFAPDHRERARSELGIGPETRLVFTVRRLVPRMGLSELLDASTLLADVGGLLVAVAGSGELEHDLHAKSTRLGLNGRVRFLGRVPEEELPLWHRAADLFVLPTRAHEGFGLVTAEALASGTPVVATPVGASPELLSPLDPRLLTRDLTPVALAEGIRRGLELGTDGFRRRAREYAAHRFSWDRAIASWESLLASTAADATGQGLEAR